MKKAMELPANFLVVLILCLVMFAVAMGIVLKMMPELDRHLKQLDEMTIRLIEQKLMSGEARVAIGIASKSIERGDNEVFGIGIKNLLEDRTSFTIAVTCNSAYADDGSEICSGTPAQTVADGL